jgi:hypothetical protein
MPEKSKGQAHRQQDESDAKGSCQGYAIRDLTACSVMSTSENVCFSPRASSVFLCLPDGQHVYQQLGKIVSQVLGMRESGIVCSGGMILRGALAERGRF